MSIGFGNHLLTSSSHQSNKKRRETEENGVPVKRLTLSIRRTRYEVKENSDSDSKNIQMEHFSASTQVFGVRMFSSYTPVRL